MTYSIVASCPDTGQIGVAVQSHWFAAGVVCWAKAGVGAVATQAMALIDHGPLGIELMGGGAKPEEAMERRLSLDPTPQVRQVAMIDAQSRVSVHTGSETIPESGHFVGDGFSCQANMMWNSSVWGSMADAFVGTNGDLPTRMLAALYAAESEGGDIRGKQSARLLVVESEIHPQPWKGTIVDISVDDNSEPLVELDRLLKMHNEYVNINNLDVSEITHTKHTRNPEIAFWKSIGLVQSGRINEARVLASIAFKENSGWEELLRRCANNGLAGVTDDTISALLHPNQDD
ncbi:MAG: Zn-dependent protease [Marine Group II euryarchaeote MED-G35]|nr:MAG: Zn-dependent protease [Marine Group II euryarchaeote MED-G35]